MKGSLLILLTLTIGMVSCSEAGTSPAGSVETGAAPANAPDQKASANFNERYIHTQYKYLDPAGKGLILQNSLPKGGLRYTDLNGRNYIYAIYWTNVINETDQPVDLTIHFPADSLELPSAPGRHFRILLPFDTMTIDKESQMNYGLTNLESFLNTALNKATSLNRTVRPKESQAFYFVTLFAKGLDGTLRTGLSIKGTDLYYTINDKEVECGRISGTGWVLQK